MRNVYCEDKDSEEMPAYFRRKKPMNHTGQPQRRLNWLRGKLLRSPHGSLETKSCFDHPASTYAKLGTSAKVETGVGGESTNPWVKSMRSSNWIMKPQGVWGENLTKIFKLPPPSLLGDITYPFTLPRNQQFNPPRVSPNFEALQ